MAALQHLFRSCAKCTATFSAQHTYILLPRRMQPSRMPYELSASAGLCLMKSFAFAVLGTVLDVCVRAVGKLSSAGDSRDIRCQCEY